MAIHIGTSGWSYDHWEGLLYPQGSSSAKRLESYIRRYSTVEVNNTFYRWPKEEVFARWRASVPEDFLLSIKASRGLTQFRRLNEPEDWLERMLAGIHRLGEKLGVLLFQLPPQFAYDYDRLAQFLAKVPSRLRIACEFRHPSWHRDEVFALLRKHRAAYCVMAAINLPRVLEVTAPFVYVRLHGSSVDRAGNFTREELEWWAEQIRGWDDRGLDVFAYFNNDAHGYALANADTLIDLLGVPAPG